MEEAEQAEKGATAARVQRFGDWAMDTTPQEPTGSIYLSLADVELKIVDYIGIEVEHLGYFPGGGPRKENVGRTGRFKFVKE